MKLSKQHARESLQLKTTHVAVLSAMAIWGAVHATQAQAACAGSISSPVSTAISVQCNGLGSAGNLTVSDNTTYVNSNTINVSPADATSRTNVLLQFDGQGRSLTNNGTISNNLVINNTGTGARNRTAVLMGAATINAGTGTTYSGANAGNLPAANSTTAKLNTAPAPGVNLVGQTIVLGRYNAAEGDFAVGVTRLITAFNSATNTVTFAEALPADFAGAGTDPVGYKVVSNFGGGDNVINNNGTISAQITAAEINASRNGTASASSTAQAKAVSASVEGVYIINNSASGIIRAKHDGIGATYAIEQGGAAEEMTVNNSGLIEAERTATLTLVAATPTANPTATALITGNPAVLAAQTVSLVNAINTQEEAESFTLNNSATGLVRAKGDFASTIYMRAAEKEITNSGLIEYVGTKGFAIGAVSDGGGVRTLELENTKTGEIKGDILVTNGNALRYYLLTTQNIAGGLDSRLNINNQFGQSDSTIENAGKITGNFYLSNGTHRITNEETGVITGNMDVDQRNTYSAAGNGTLAGTKQFSFENAGKYTGNITVRTAAGSKITLAPTITGAGLTKAADAAAKPATGIAGMGGTLKVWDGTNSTIATTTTIKPIVGEGVSVKNGTFYKVADTLFGTDLPTVQDSLLIDWSASNTGGALLLGASLKNAASIKGVNGAQAKALNALLGSNDDLAAEVLALTDSKELVEVGQSLLPEVNGAGFQSALRGNSQFMGVVSQRLNALYTAQGETGVSAGEQDPQAGFWLQGLGYNASQDKQSGVNGYNADAYGFAAGYDRLVDEAGNWRVGAAIGYINSNVDTKNSANELDMDSYKATVYASWTQPTYFVNGSVGVSKHDFDTERSVAGNTVKGDFDAWQYTASVDAGMPFKTQYATLIPTAGLAYSYFDQDGYTEKGNGALRIKGDNNDSLRSSLGLRAVFPLKTSKIKSEFELRGIWQHEFADVQIDTTASFAGGNTFKTNGLKINRDTANLGASLRLAGGEQTKQSLEISYDAELRNNFVGHTGRLTARFDF